MRRLTIGPLSVRRWQDASVPVTRGPLSVTPVAEITEARWRRGDLTLGFAQARPHHVRVQTIAGARRISLRPARWFIPVLVAFGPALALVVGWARRDRSGQGRACGD